MATKEAKDAIKAAMSFKDTPAPNCRTGQHFIKTLCDSHGKSPIREYYEKAKKNTSREELR